MPARRANVRRADDRLTPEAVAIFKAALELKPSSEEWVAKSWELHRALKLRPWQLPPLWYEVDDTPETTGHWQPDMIELRRQLESELRR